MNFDKVKSTKRKTGKKTTTTTKWNEWRQIAEWLKIDTGSR